jgi:hypothetical protein
MSYRGELRCGVRALKRSITAMGEREAESFTGPHLQPLRDALRAQYGCLLYRATTILETEAGDDDPPNEE